MFPRELMPTPVHWVEKTVNLVWSKEHKAVSCSSTCIRKTQVRADTMQGGHFAALEKPEELWQDVEEFIKVAWGKPRVPKPA